MGYRGRRLGRFGTGALAGLLTSVALSVGLAAPAAAVQTSTFGISPAPGTNSSGGNRLQATTGPGQSVTDQLLVWNRTSAPLTLDLSVVPAHLGPQNVPALGGDVAPTQWIHLDQTEVTLPPFGQQNVGVTIELPRVLPKLPAQAAVVAEPVAKAGAAPTVVIRLAVMVSIAGATGAPARAPMATVGWVAVGVLSFVAVGGAVVGLVMRRRGRRVAAA